MAGAIVTNGAGNRYKKHKKSEADGAFYAVYEHAEFLYDVIDYAKDFVTSSHDNLDKSVIKQIKVFARNNFVINLVSSIETGLKHTIMNKKDWNESGLSKLLEDHQTNLSEAYDLFKANKVTREYILCQSYSFQNINTIERVFSELQGSKKFLNAVGEIRIRKHVPTTLNEMDRNWRGVLVNLFEIRNRFIHEGRQSNITAKQAETFSLVTYWFYRAVTYAVGTRMLRTKFSLPATEN